MIYTVQPVPEAAVREQRAAYAALLQNLGPASASEIERAMAEREPAEPEPGLTTEVVETIRARRGERRG
jgi:hypothetical protein